MEEGLLDAVWLALTLGKPLLLEGEVGTGKTAVAEALAQGLGRRLIRLQCYEGIDADQAVYAWNYGGQLLAMQAGEDPYQERHLSPRPLLTAVREGAESCLLIDEVDRADEAFEAFLLEFLQDFEVTVPEVGTVRGEHGRPVVVLTSNRTRPLSDALRRRAVYYFCPEPGAKTLAAILRARVAEVPEGLANQVAELVVALRALPLVRPPATAEAIDFTRGLLALGAERVEREAALRAVGLLAKDARDVALVREYLEGT
jgi:MoxR-like ATPase